MKIIFYFGQILLNKINHITIRKTLTNLQPLPNQNLLNMKNKYLLRLLLFFISLSAVAQKDEIKTAQNELNNGNPQAALSTLKACEYLITNAKDQDRSEFFNLKGKAFTSLANKNIETAKNLCLAVSAYEELIVSEVDSGNLKYAVQAKTAIKEIKDNLEKSANEDSNVNKYADCANKMYYLYQMDKKDTLKLYYAASNFMNAKEYDSALKNFEELKSLNFTGKGIQYFATNKKSKIEELFASANHRDSNIKAGTHEIPRNVMAPSKKIDVYRSLAQIYTEKGNTDNAENYYKKIIDLNPKYIDAYINMAYLKLDKRKALTDEISNLGTSAKDMKVYEELKAKKDLVIKSAVSYLEKGNTIEPKNIEISKMLLNLYRALDMTNEYNALKAKI